MDTKRSAKLQSLLTEYDTSGIKFADAKQKLLSEGFTEVEIAEALYAAPFDGKHNKPADPNPVTAMFVRNPELAEETSRQLLLAEAEKDRDKAATLSTAAHLAPGQHAQLHYSVRAADALDIPFFKLFFFGIALGIGLVLLKVPGDIVDVVIRVYSLLWFVLIGYKLFKKQRLVNKLRKKPPTQPKN